MNSKGSQYFISFLYLYSCLKETCNSKQPLFCLSSLLKIRGTNSHPVSLANPFENPNHENLKYKKTHTMNNYFNKT